MNNTWFWQGWGGAGEGSNNNKKRDIAFLQDIWNAKHPGQQSAELSLQSSLDLVKSPYS